MDLTLLTLNKNEQGSRKCTRVPFLQLNEYTSLFSIVDSRSTSFFSQGIRNNMFRLHCEAIAIAGEDGSTNRFLRRPIS